MTGPNTIAPNAEAITKQDMSLLFQVDAAGLRAAVDVAATDDHRPILEAVNVCHHAEDSGREITTFVATDSYRLRVVGEISDLTPQSTMLLPAPDVKKACVAAGKNGRVTIGLMHDQQTVVLEPIASKGAKPRIITQVVEGQYPNWTRLLPEKVTTGYEIRLSHRLEGRQITGWLRRLKTLAEGWINTPVVLIPNHTDGTTDMVVEAHDRLVLTTDVLRPLAADTPEVALNPAFLAELLTHHQQGVLEVRPSEHGGRSLKPTVARDSYMLDMLMPMRTN